MKTGSSVTFRKFLIKSYRPLKKSISTKLLCTFNVEYLSGLTFKPQNN